MPSLPLFFFHYPTTTTYTTLKERIVVAIMASVTTIKYFKEGTSPPIFLAGSFSDWEPQEMEHEEKDGEHFFYKNIKVDEGKEVQYKFRIGHGDWWVLDETAPVGKLLRQTKIIFNSLPFQQFLRTTINSLFCEANFYIKQSLITLVTAIIYLSFLQSLNPA